MSCGRRGSALWFLFSRSSQQDAGIFPEGRGAGGVEWEVRGQSEFNNGCVQSFSKRKPDTAERGDAILAEVVTGPTSHEKKIQSLTSLIFFR